MSKSYQKPQAVEATPSSATVDAQTHQVPQHRRCPQCWGTQRGTGRAYSKKRRTRYYKCTTCGFGFHVLVTNVVIKAIEYSQIDELETR